MLKTFTFKDSPYQIGLALNRNWFKLKNWYTDRTAFIFERKDVKTARFLLFLAQKQRLDPIRTNWYSLCGKRVYVQNTNIEEFEELISKHYGKLKDGK